MAVPVWQNVGSVSNVALATDPTPAYPAGISAGDLLVLFVFIRSSTGTVVDPSGWTRVFDDTNVGPGSSFVFLRKADGTESGTLTVDCSAAAGVLAQAVIGRVTGWNDAGAIGDAVEGNATNSGTGTTDSQASLTTGGPDRLVVAWRWFGASIAASVEAYASGGSETWTQQVESGTSTGNNGTIHVDTCAVPAADTIDGGTDTITSATWANRVFAILAPVGATSKPKSLGMTGVG